METEPFIVNVGALTEETSTGKESLVEIEGVVGVSSASSSQQHTENRVGIEEQRETRIEIEEQRETSVEIEEQRETSTSLEIEEQRDIGGTRLRFRPISRFLRIKGKSRLTEPVDVEDGTKTKSSNIPGELRKVSLISWIPKLLIACLLIATSRIDWLRSREYFDFELWRWEVLFMAIIWGRMVSGWMIWLVVFLIRHKTTLYYLLGVKSSLRNFIWTVLILTVWLPMLLDEQMRPRRGHNITRFLICLVAVSAIWMVKNLFVRFLASFYHLNVHLERIQGSLFNQYMVESLLGTPLIEVDQRQKHKNIRLDQLYHLNKDDVSASTMKRLINIIRRGTITTIEEAKTPITTENEAKNVAKNIFQNVAKPGSNHIHLEDLLRFMREDEAVKMMSLLEGANDNKRISKSALENWVVDAFRERRFLALTLDDTKSIVKKLRLSLSVIAGPIVLVVSLLILGVTTFHVILVVVSQLAIMAFFFGNSCKTAFEAIVFLIAIHPFDVGDRCEIQGVELVVEEINALSTVFLRHDNLKTMYPNSVLGYLPISNHHRSPNMGDAIDFCIHVSTPLEKVAIMKQRILRYIEIKENHWASGAAVVLRDVEDMNRLKLSVWVTHCTNFQDMGARFARRECLVEEIVKILKELEIEYRMLPVDVNLRSIPADTSRLPSNWGT